MDRLFSFTAPNQSVDYGLGFMAQSAVVDNPANLWVVFPDQSVTVAPQSSGVIIPLTPATQRAHVVTVPPPGQVTNVFPGTGATVRFTSDALYSTGSNFAGILSANANTSAVAPPAGQATTGITPGFFVQSVLVENPGGTWVTIFDNNGQGHVIAPWTVGAIVVMSVAASTIFYNTLPPTGQVNRAVGNGPTISVSDAKLMPTPGLSVFPVLANAFARSSVIVPPGTPDTGNVPLGFSANSIIVDNPGGAWVLVSDGLAFHTVGPWTVGAVIPCSIANPNARYTTNNPPPGQSTTGSGNNATIEWTEQVLPASAGVQLGGVLSTNSPSVVPFGNQAVGPGAAAATFSFTVALGVGTFYLRRLSLSWTGLSAGSPLAYATLAATNVTGQLPTIRLTNNIGGNGPAVLDDDFGRDFLITTTAGAVLTITVQAIIGGQNFTANSQAVTVWGYMVPVII